MLAEIAKIDWVAMTLPSFQRYISAEDADQIIAFYETPVGQRLLIAQPRMVQEVSSVATSMGREIGMKIGAKYADQITANQRKMNGQQSGDLPTANPDRPK